MPLSDATIESLMITYYVEISALIRQLGKTITLHFKSDISGVTDPYNDYIRDLSIKEPNFKDPTTAPTVVENTTTIKALLKYNPKDFETFGIKVEEGQSILRLKTFIYYADIISRCDFIVPSQEITPEVYTRYKLLRAPVPQGFRNQFLLTYWKSI